MARGSEVQGLGPVPDAGADEDGLGELVQCLVVEAGSQFGCLVAAAPGRVGVVVGERAGERGEVHA